MGWYSSGGRSHDDRVAMRLSAEAAVGYTQRRFRNFVIGLLAAAILSCAMPQEDPGMGTVRIILPGAEEGRMTFQEYASTLRFFLSFAGPEELAEQELRPGHNQISLAEGNWSLILRALDDTGEVARDEKSITVTTGETSRVDFHFTLKNPYPDKEPLSEEDPPSEEEGPDEEDPPSGEDPTGEEDPGEEDPPDEEDPSGDEDDPGEEDPSGNEEPRPQEFSLTISFEEFLDLESIPEPILSYSRSREKTITLEGEGYDSVKWEVYGVVLGEGSSFTLSLDDALRPDGLPPNPNYNFNGRHPLVINVIKEGVPYGRTLFFTVTD